ncbi:transaldolase family protein [Erysipelothrix sp. HDW6C]|uniref:transaldolase family protein n=1 Tax=Erysipelothrix sp. HDW6C TaxID=2714930 RepID=UPI001F0EC3B5|nr:transaldolase family protein [Erysipelothrix sp. HDW6C]
MKLKEMIEKYPQTQVWNDSCATDELTYALEYGATGATTNPVIVLQVLKDNLSKLEARIRVHCDENPHDSEDEIAWRIIEELGVNASQYLLPEFEKSKGKRGRISFQVNAKYYNNTEHIVAHGLKMASLIPNSQIKAPASAEGIKAFEELTYRGVSINATVSYSVAQAIAVAEAVERGLERRRIEGLDVSTMSPVCTIMSGRVDDYLKSYVDKQGLIVNPEILEHAGVEIAKRAYEIYQERGYTTKILIAAFRNHYHWSAFIGADMILTIPYKWQVRYNNSNVAIEENIHKHIPQPMLDELLTLPDFKKAYEVDGMTVDEFAHFGPFKATMHQFLSGYDELVRIIRDIQI